MNVLYADFDHTINLGFKIGYTPQVFPNIHRDSKWIGTSERIEGQVEYINNFYKNPDGTPVVSDFKIPTKYNYLGYEAGYNYAIPLGFHLQYRWRVFAIRTGFIYSLVRSSNRTYKSKVGPDTVRRNDPTIRAYDDIDENFDGDTDFVSEAYGLRPTYGEEVYFRENITMEKWEIPLTVTANVFMVAYVTVYIGGGVSYFYGAATRTIFVEGASEEKKKFFVDDVDRFIARGFGINMVIGTEYRGFEDLGIIFEIYYTYGESSIVRDSVITGAYTNNSLFHANDELDWGGTEYGKDGGIRFGKGVVRYGNLSFNSMTLFIGVVYYVFKM